MAGSMGLAGNAAADCVWPGLFDEPPVVTPQPGDTVTCTGSVPTFGNATANLTVVVTEGASVDTVVLNGVSSTILNRGTNAGGAELSAAGGTFLNYGTSGGVNFGGPDYTARNFGAIVNDIATNEWTPAGAITSAMQAPGPGLIVNQATADGVGSITTHAAYRAGIVVRDPNGLVTIRNDAFLQSGAVAGRASITTTQRGAPGIFLIDDAEPLTSSGSVENTIINNGLIETSGDDAPGVLHGQLFDEIPASGLTHIDNGWSGIIETAGDDAQGILSWGFEVEIANAGQITTRGNLSSGIEAIGVRDVSVVNAAGATITTSGSTFAPGLVIQRLLPGDDFVDLGVNAGSIGTSGLDSPGIVTILDATIRNGCDGCTASIVTAGAGSAGMQLGVVEPVLNIDAPSREGRATNRGRIETGGALAPGMFAIGSDNTLINEEDGQIVTRGDAAPGIEISGSGYITSAGLISTEGVTATGIFADGSRVNVDEFGGRIETTGDAAMGIHAIADAIEVNLAELTEVETTGTGAHGAIVEGADTQLWNRGTITTWGADAHAIRVSTVEGTVFQDGVLQTQGASAFGISATSLAAGAGNPVRVENEGTIVTVGEDADGINAVGGFFTVSNAGGISTSGANADGIELGGKPVFSFAPVNRVNNQGEIVVADPSSVGVRLSTTADQEAVFVNESTGIVTSPGFAVAGGDGFDEVRNAGLLDGLVDLGAGDDVFVRESGSRVSGMVDGGAEVDGSATGDELVIRFNGEEALTGDTFSRFETVNFGGIGRLLLTGDLVTRDATFGAGEVILRGLIDGDADLQAEATLGGDGRVAGDLAIEGGTLSPGESTGSLLIDGNLSLTAGRMVMEAAGPLDRDVLSVAGDVDLAGGRLDVVLGYVPAPGEVLEFFDLGGGFTVLDGFTGVRGLAAQGAEVPLGTTFVVDLGGLRLDGVVTAVVPLPPALPLFAAACLLISARQSRCTM